MCTGQEAVVIFLFLTGWPMKTTWLEIWVFENLQEANEDSEGFFTKIFRNAIYYVLQEQTK